MRSQTTVPRETFIIAFTDADYDESACQTTAAKALGAWLQDVHDTHAEIGQLFPEVSWHAETPLMRTSLAPMSLLSGWGSYGDWAAESREWLADCYPALCRPYRVHKVHPHASWLWRFDGPHPTQTHSRSADAADGSVPTALAPIDDVERLLGAPGYFLGWESLKAAEPLDRWKSGLRRSAGSQVRHTIRRLRVKRGPTR